MKKHDSQINVRIPEELHREVKIEAARKGKSLSEIITDLLTNWLKENEQGTPKQRP